MNGALAVLAAVAGWKKGIVRQPSGAKTLLHRLDLARHWPLGVPLAVFAYMFSLWIRKGKDPATGGPLVVAYAPPEANGRPLLPAEMGALIDERLDPRDISASVVDLAVKGFLKIEERKTEGLLFDKSDYALRKVKEPGGGLLPFERLLMERIFQGRGPEVKVSELRMSFYKNLEPLREAAFKELKELKCFAADPVNVTARYVGIAFLVLFFGAGAAFALRVLLGGAFSLVPVAVILSGILMLVFAPFMPVKTPKGVRLLGRIKGFEEFLVRAEKDRLERMNDPNLFEKYLPHAIALDVSDRWADAFEGISQEPPRWYASADGPVSFRPAFFHRSLGSALSGISTAMHSAPRSSGSGFSGGGRSGGGGGGSW